MYEYIKGTLIETDISKVILDVNGIGYKISVPVSSHTSLPQIGSNLILFTSLIIKEDSHNIFGFLTKQDRDLFEMVISVSGIGPKTGLLLLGHLDFSNLQMAISQANSKLISNVPGIGKKTAERLIIELRDKFKLLNKSNSSLEKTTVTSDAINALITLGYSPLKAQKAIQSALKSIDNEPEVEELITMALRKN